VPHFQDRNSVIDFLTQDFVIVPPEVEPSSPDVITSKQRRKSDYMEGFDVEPMLNFGSNPL